MGLQIPEGLQDFFRFTTGEEWPDVDEDLLWQLATEWHGYAGELYGLVREVDDAIDAVLGTFSGEGAQAFEARLRTFTQTPPEGGTEPYLQTLATHCKGLGTFCDKTALDVQYAKWMIIAQAIMLVIQIIAALASVFGAFAVPGMVAAGQAFFRFIIQMLIQQILMGLIIQVGLDVIIQAAQFMAGTRKEWDAEKTRMSALSGVVGGVLGTAMLGAGKPLGKLFGKAVTNPTGRAFGTAVGTLGHGAAHEWGTEAIVNYISYREQLAKDPNAKYDAPSGHAASAGAVDSAVNLFGKSRANRAGGAHLNLGTLPQIQLGELNFSAPDLSGITPGSTPDSRPSNPDPTTLPPPAAPSPTPGNPSGPATPSAPTTPGSSTTPGNPAPSGGAAVPGNPASSGGAAVPGNPASSGGAAVPANPAPSDGAATPGNPAPSDGSMAPGAPVQPDGAAAPGSPATPGIPTTPDGAAAPGNPAAPGSPGVPDGSAAPSDPAAPDSPATPDGAAAPATPGSGGPGVPGSGATPSTPGGTARPDGHVAPDTGAKPGVPGGHADLSRPGAPAAPESSVQSDKAGGPGTTGPVAPPARSTVGNQSGSAPGDAAGSTLDVDDQGAVAVRPETVQPITFTSAASAGLTAIPLIAPIGASVGGGPVGRAPSVRGVRPDTVDSVVRPGAAVVQEVAADPGRAQRSVPLGFAIPAGHFFATDTDSVDVANAAMALPVSRGWFTVAAHTTGDGRIRVGGETLSTTEAAALVQKLPGYQGQPIVLVSSNGATSAGPALSTLLNVPVVTAVGDATITTTGTVTATGWQRISPDGTTAELGPELTAGMRSQGVHSAMAWDAELPNAAITWNGTDYSAQRVRSAAEAPGLLSLLRKLFGDKHSGPEAIAGFQRPDRSPPSPADTTVTPAAPASPESKVRSDAQASSGPPAGEGGSVQGGTPEAVPDADRSQGFKHTRQVAPAVVPQARTDEAVDRLADSRFAELAESGSLTWTHMEGRLTDLLVRQLRDRLDADGRPVNGDLTVAQRREVHEQIAARTLTAFRSSQGPRGKATFQLWWEGVPVPSRAEAMSPLWRAFQKVAGSSVQRSELIGEVVQPNLRLWQAAGFPETDVLKSQGRDENQKLKNQVFHWSGSKGAFTHYTWDLGTTDAVPAVKQDTAKLSAADKEARDRAAAARTVRQNDHLTVENALPALIAVWARDRSDAAVAEFLNGRQHATSKKHYLDVLKAADAPAIGNLNFRPISQTQYASELRAEQNLQRRGTPPTGRTWLDGAAPPFHSRRQTDAALRDGLVVGVADAADVLPVPVDSQISLRDFLSYVDFALGRLDLDARLRQEIIGSAERLSQVTGSFTPEQLYLNRVQERDFAQFVALVTKSLGGPDGVPAEFLITKGQVPKPTDAQWAEIVDIVRNPRSTWLVAPAETGGFAQSGAGVGVADSPAAAQFRAAATPAPAGMTFYGNAEDSVQTAFAQRYVPDPALYVVFAHGDPHRIYLRFRHTDGTVGEHSLDAAGLAELIRDDFVKSGKREVLLVSCDTGASDQGFAAQLAQQLGVPVAAPDSTAVLTATGKVYALPDRRTGHGVYGGPAFRRFEPQAVAPVRLAAYAPADAAHGGLRTAWAETLRQVDELRSRVQSELPATQQLRRRLSEQLDWATELRSRATGEQAAQLDRQLQLIQRELGQLNKVDEAYADSVHAFGSADFLLEYAEAAPVTEIDQVAEGAINGLRALTGPLTEAVAINAERAEMSRRMRQTENTLYDIEDALPPAVSATAPKPSTPDTMAPPQRTDAYHLRMGGSDALVAHSGPGALRPPRPQDALPDELTRLGARPVQLSVDRVSVPAEALAIVHSRPDLAGLFDQARLARQIRNAVDNGSTQVSTSRGDGTRLALTFGHPQLVAVAEGGALVRQGEVTATDDSATVQSSLSGSLGSDAIGVGPAGPVSIGPSVQVSGGRVHTVTNARTGNIARVAADVDAAGIYRVPVTFTLTQPGEVVPATVTGEVDVRIAGADARLLESTGEQVDLLPISYVEGSSAALGMADVAGVRGGQALADQITAAANRLYPGLLPAADQFTVDKAAFWAKQPNGAYERARENVAQLQAVRSGELLTGGVDPMLDGGLRVTLRRPADGEPVAITITAEMLRPIATGEQRHQAIGHGTSETHSIGQSQTTTAGAALGLGASAGLPTTGVSAYVRAGVSRTEVSTSSQITTAVSRAVAVGPSRAFDAGLRFGFTVKGPAQSRIQQALGRSVNQSFSDVTGGSLHFTVPEVLCRPASAPAGPARLEVIPQTQVPPVFQLPATHDALTQPFTLLSIRGAQPLQTEAHKLLSEVGAASLITPGGKGDQTLAEALSPQTLSNSLTAMLQRGTTTAFAGNLGRQAALRVTAEIAKPHIVGYADGLHTQHATHTESHVSTTTTMTAGVTASAQVSALGRTEESASSRLANATGTHTSEVSGTLSGTRTDRGRQVLVRADLAYTLTAEGKDRFGAAVRRQATRVDVADATYLVMSESDAQALVRRFASESSAPEPADAQPSPFTAQVLPHMVESLPDPFAVLSALHGKLAPTGVTLLPSSLVDGGGTLGRIRDELQPGALARRAADLFGTGVQIELPGNGHLVVTATATNAQPVGSANDVVLDGQHAAERWHAQIEYSVAHHAVDGRVTRVDHVVPGEASFVLPVDGMAAHPSSAQAVAASRPVLALATDAVAAVLSPANAQRLAGPLRQALSPTMLAERYGAMSDGGTAITVQEGRHEVRLKVSAQQSEGRAEFQVEAQVVEHPLLSLLSPPIVHEAVQRSQTVEVHSGRLLGGVAYPVQTSAGLYLPSGRADGAQERRVAEAMPQVPGRFMVTAHFSDGAIEFGGRRLSPEEFAEVIDRATNWQRRPIVMLSCGASTAEFAGRVRDLLGVEVIAASGDVFQTPDGRALTGQARQRPDGTLALIPADWMRLPARPNSQPERLGADLHRGLLLAPAAGTDVSGAYRWGAEPSAPPPQAADGSRSTRDGPRTGGATIEDDEKELLAAHLPKFGSGRAGSTPLRLMTEMTKEKS